MQNRLNELLLNIENEQRTVHDLRTQILDITQKCVTIEEYSTNNITTLQQQLDDINNKYDLEKHTYNEEIQSINTQLKQEQNIVIEYKSRIDILHNNNEELSIQLEQATNKFVFIKHVILYCKFFVISILI